MNSKFIAKRLAFALCLLLTFSSMAKNKIELTLQMRGQDVYSIEGSMLKGDHSMLAGQFVVQGRADGQSINLRQGIPTTKVPNGTNMEVLDKKTVRLIEAAHGVDANMRAKVKKSFTGKLKKISIKSEEYLAAMKPVLEESGLDILRSLQIQADDAKLETRVDVSDIECEADGRDMICDSEVEIYIGVEEL